MSQADFLPEAAPVSPFQFQNCPIRTQLEGDTLWFAARDVCSALNIDWSGKTLSAIPKDWQGMGRFPTPSGHQQLRAIIEPAVYKLAFRSNKPEADAFTNWIASEVVPSIRQTGRYEAKAEPASDDTLTPEQQAQLQAIVQAKVGMLPRDVQRKAYAEMWTRFGRHFRIARYAQLPPAKMGEAVEYLVGLEIKAAMALPSTCKDSLSVAPAVSKMEMATDDPHAACLRRLDELRDMVRIGCHPGAVTMKMAAHERQVYWALHAAYVAADEALTGVYSILDAGRRMVEACGRG